MFGAPSRRCKCGKVVSVTRSQDGVAKLRAHDPFQKFKLSRPSRGAVGQPRPATLGELVVVVWQDGATRE